MNTHCPCCDWNGPTFQVARGADQRDLDCPACNSRSRHRLLHFYLQLETPLLSAPMRMLHFAPEKSLNLLLKTVPSLHRITTDRNRSDVRVRADIRQLPFHLGCFDLIMANHVMEHIPDDRAAHRELFRICAPNGIVLLTFPYYPSQSRTDEDPAVTDPSQRKSRWGRDDHYRSAGTDYSDRLRDVGFNVVTDSYAQSFSARDRRRYGLLENVTIFRCTKPCQISPSAVDTSTGR